MNIYVGNLSFSVKDSDLREAFEAFGTVESAKVIEEGYSGRSRGFGFVEMPEKSEAESAISALNGKSLQGRDIKVNEAKPKTDRNRVGGFGGGGGRRY
jgi:RNA recognition motif-containing protein